MERRIKLLRIGSLIAAAALLFWWPLSHLFYSDWYHGLLGFLPGSYQPSMVIVIGICGFLPVMQLLLIALDPLRNRQSIVTMMIFSLLLIVMYICLISQDRFPKQETFNIAVCGAMFFFYLVVTPWKV